MVTQDQIRSVLLAPQEAWYTTKMGLLASIGGTSHIREETDRLHNLHRDQAVGQFGQLALALYWFGDSRQYDIARWHANLNPTKGDNGSDIPGMNVDVKTSLMRASPNPLDYKLLVRPRERHPGWVYILALVRALKKEGSEVFLVGWMDDEHLPSPDQGGTFDGAHVVQAKDLHPLPPVFWAWRSGHLTYPSGE